jgi:hypothetical protein
LHVGRRTHRADLVLSLAGQVLGLGPILWQLASSWPSSPAHSSMSSSAGRQGPSNAPTSPCSSHDRRVAQGSFSSAVPLLVPATPRREPGTGPRFTSRAAAPVVDRAGAPWPTRRRARHHSKARRLGRGKALAHGDLCWRALGRDPDRDWMGSRRHARLAVRDPLEPGDDPRVGIQGPGPTSPTGSALAPAEPPGTTAAMDDRIRQGRDAEWRLAFEDRL